MDQDGLSIMVRTPEGSAPAGPDVKIDRPIDMPAGETTLLTLHSLLRERFVVLALGHCVKLELGP